MASHSLFLFLFHFQFLLSLLFFPIFSYSNPPGFLSLSCGGSTIYTDHLNITWIPDSSYIKTGNSTSTNSINYKSEAHSTVRFFPVKEKTTQNCYKIPILSLNLSLVLIRARFCYKNYDKKENPPAFYVSLGRANVALINLTKLDPCIEEFVWKIGDENENLIFCLNSIEKGGNPVISSLEIRPLPETAYNSGFNHEFGDNLLRKRFRINCGYIRKNSTRFPFDYYDRIWDPDERFSPSLLSAGFKIQTPLNFSDVNEKPPVLVLQTARVLARKNILNYNLPLGKVANYFLVLYFAGITPVSPTFDILINNNIVYLGYKVNHGQASSVSFNVKMVDFLKISFYNISFFPQINSIEIYEIIAIPSKCSPATVSALKVIQETTGKEFEWENDPCNPIQWNHIKCDGNLVISLELSDMDLGAITPTFGDLLDLKYLDLHNSSLSGEITNLGTLQKLEILNLSFNKFTSFGPGFDSMTSLQILDLRNNSLEGTVPDILGNLKDLQFLNLENNKLQGVLPQSLHRKNLQIRTTGNLCLSFLQSGCKKNNYKNKNKKYRPKIEVPQVISVFPTKPQSSNYRSNHRSIFYGATGSVLFIIILCSIIIFFILYRKKKKRNRYSSPSETWTASEVQGCTAAKSFSYKEIKIATNNFKEIVGRGGFGSVFFGKLFTGKLVAVKVRSDKSQTGADSFINEVRILSQIRHENLVTLEGFCCESKQQILVYEYLAGGSLADNLYGSNSKKASLNWARRLKIALDAAKGLDYLHNWSNPRIIHRDMKCSNILLDSEMNAKVGDFGLSKQILSDSSHVSTVVKGTAGYLDPEYFVSQQLTEKSDVYSFGVVLLELICGREPLSHVGTPDSFNLVLWAKPYLQAGSFEVVDESIMGGFNMESMRRAACIAVKCVERDPILRPIISEVLAELKESYSIQLTSFSDIEHSI
ncbi:hypothetical protein LUZ60_007851 [Juncus effusus]|nr:hypothetical protein LUZ60_007851 [Juncus effusus]